MSSENVMSDISELYERAENIVIASVTGYESYLDGGYLPFVFSQAVVEETLKGNLQKDDEIIISEVGEHREDGSDFSIDGVPLLYPGMKVILFLGLEGVLENNQKTGYGLTGSYVGKFIYHPDGTIYNFSFVGRR